MSWPVAMAPNWIASTASSRMTTRPLWASSHITLMLVGGVVERLVVDGERGQAPDPWHAIDLAVVIEHRRARLVRADIGGVRDLGNVDRLDQLLGHRLVVEGGVDHHDVVEAGIGPELGQHLLFGVEEVIDDLVAGGLLESLDRPGLVGAIALPVEHMQFVGCAPNGRSETATVAAVSDCDQFAVMFVPLCWRCQALQALCSLRDCVQLVPAGQKVSGFRRLVGAEAPPCRVTEIAAAALA